MRGGRYARRAYEERESYKRSGEEATHISTAKRHWRSTDRAERRRICTNEIHLIDGRAPRDRERARRIRH